MPELTEVGSYLQPPLPDGYQIRSSTVDDLKPVLNVLKVFFEKRLVLPRTRAEIQVLLPTGFVLIYQGAVVGFSSIEIYSKKLAEIQCLAIAEEHQGKGLGRVLVGHCVALARKMRVMEVMVISSSDRFLIQQGFDYALPNQKKALFLQLRSREEVYQEIDETGDE